MNLSEAIKVKERHHSMLQRLGVPGLYEADKLSIEALIRVKLLRTPTNYPISKQLPGETEE